MRIARLKAPGGLENLRLFEQEIVDPKDDEIQVRIRACSLNYHDTMVATGKKPCADGRVLLSDGAGEVTALGRNIRDFSIGDSVVSTYWPDWLSGEATAQTKAKELGDDVDGYAREYVCAPSHAFAKAPPGYTHVESATLPCAAVTAWRGLMVSGHAKPGDWVLTLGTGSVSLFALQFAKATGARVIATSSSGEKIEKLKQLGADETINYLTDPNWGDIAKDLTGGRGVDHVMEVGGPGTLTESIKACRMGGHIALIGILTGFSGQVSIPALFSNQIRISGISIGSRADQENMMRAVTANRIKPVIDRVFPFEDLPEAFTYYNSRNNFGKVCVEL